MNGKTHSVPLFAPSVTAQPKIKESNSLGTLTSYLLLWGTHHFEIIFDDWDLPSRAAVKETKKQMFPAIRKNEGSMIFIKIEVMYVCLSIDK